MASVAFFIVVWMPHRAAMGWAFPSAALPVPSASAPNPGAANPDEAGIRRGRFDFDKRRRGRPANIDFRSRHRWPHINIARCAHKRGQRDTRNPFECVRFHISSTLLKACQLTGQPRRRQGVADCSAKAVFFAICRKQKHTAQIGILLFHFPSTSYALKAFWHHSCLCR